MNAIANMTHAFPEYKSQVEQDWATFGPMLLYAEYNERVQVMHYEPVTFNLPGGKYTPDFMAILQSGWVVFVECKGSRKQKNYRDARSKLRAAKALHPWFEFVEAVGKGENWEIDIL